MIEKPFEVLSMILVSFFAAFVVAFNIGVNKKGKSFVQLLAQVLMHGFSGAIVGALSTLYVKDILIVCAIAAIGGMFGQQLIRALANRFMKKYLPTDSDKNDKDNSDECV